MQRKGLKNAAPSSALHPGWRRKTFAELNWVSLLLQVGPNVSIAVGPNQVVKRKRDEIVFLYKLARSGERDLFLRRIEVWEEAQQRTLVFLTNQNAASAPANKLPAPIHEQSSVATST